MKMEKSSNAKRALVITKAVTKITLAHTKSLLSQKLLTKQQSTQQSLKAVFDAITQLKGLSVKVAQQIAITMPFLPKNYLDELEKSFDSIPPINRALIRKIIKNNFQKYPEELFDSFDDTAYKSASIGQVHIGAIGDEKVAIKVQYPGMNSNIQNDIKLLKLALMKITKSNNIDHLIKELSDKLEEELDYTKEAKNIDFFRENNLSEQIIIPKVFEDYCAPNILTLSFLEGDSFAAFISKNPDIESRNHYAQLIFDNFFANLYKNKTIHADPNPANFIFMGDNKLGIIDFGCVKKIDNDFLKLFTKLHISLIENRDDHFITNIYKEIGMIDDTPQAIKFYTEIIKPMEDIYIGVLKNDRYKFTNNFTFTKNGFDTARDIKERYKTTFSKFHQDYLFIDRTLLGYYSLFEKLDCTIDTQYVKSLMREYHENNI
jgi:predicted unusual protein kinase regulating ubiquinone biosynthesis (AarF/ABC1/UbiB family)